MAKEDPKDVLGFLMGMLKGQQVFLQTLAMQLPKDVVMRVLPAFEQNCDINEARTNASPATDDFIAGFAEMRQNLRDAMASGMVAGVMLPQGKKPK